MIGWLALTEDQRRTSIEQAAIRSGILTKAIEKDWWVTLVLKVLFELPQADFFIFKGGTSLSKGFKLIERFSEDIDISLAPEAFDRAYMSEPTHTYVKKLKKLGCEFTNTTIKDALEAMLLAYGVPAGMIQISAEPIPENFPDTDPQSLYVAYRSLYPPHPYLADRVKIEFSVRSLKDPFQEISIQSNLWEYFPNSVYQEIPFTVRGADPIKTFLEKIFLLHEKFSILNKGLVPTGAAIAERHSRHLYDLVQMNHAGIGKHLHTDHTLYGTLVEHRRQWVRSKHVNYNSLYPATVLFVPPPEIIKLYKADYGIMQTDMIYGKTHSFEELISILTTINQEISKIPLNIPQEYSNVSDGSISQIETAFNLSNQT